MHPVFFAALRNAVDSPASLPVVVHAAEDYLSGIVHDGPRGVVQQHFGNTKARRDPAAASVAPACPTTSSSRSGYGAVPVSDWRVRSIFTSGTTQCRWRSSTGRYFFVQIG
ncbi:MAG: hypothetical protein M5T61_19945 [Acidimicrobiia bacterium]|nr:hypothetical protein [Acidimicrobiia bacterium]